MRSKMWNVCLAMSLAAALVACGSSREASGTSGAGSAGDAAGDTPDATSPPSVRTTSEPADPCGWIPISEVEAVVGKLAEPPHSDDGCRYTMVMPESVSAKRQESIGRSVEVGRDLETRPDLLALYHPERDSKTYAMTLSVDVSGSGAGGEDTTAESNRSEGWDWLTMPGRSSFRGRIGHVRISVLGRAPDVPRDLTQALATRVRDRIPDLPFPATNPNQVGILGREEKHPCSLLTRAEAEAVLGPLAVEPYRASSYYPPLALGTGYGCAFYAAGHHVFSIVPTWTGGQETFDLNKGVGALISEVMPQDLVIIKGPWDKSQIGLSGELLFLMGDRLLEVHYKTSSTDMRGAIKLAAQAMQRMSPAD